MNAESFDTLARLLARSAILADGGAVDAAGALRNRAQDWVDGLTDNAVADLFGFLAGWVADQMEAGAHELAFAAELLRDADDAPSMRLAIRSLLDALAAQSRS